MPRLRTAPFLGALLALSVSHQPALAQEPIPLTISSGYPTTFIWAATIEDTFVPAVDKYIRESGGEYVVNWTEAYGGQLGGPADQAELVEIGAADIGNVVIPVEQDILPLESVAFVVPFGTGDVSLATEAVHTLRESVPELNAAWEPVAQLPPYAAECVSRTAWWC